MKKRLLSTMLALCLVLTMLPLNALATDEPPVETETRAELQEEKPTTPENPTPVTPTEVTTDEQTESPNPGGTDELRNPLEESSNDTILEEESIELSEEMSEPMPLVDLPTSGTCGANLTWRINGQTLTISGTGSMTDYNSPSVLNMSTTPPWLYSDYEGNVGHIRKIQNVIIQDGVTSIGNHAFHDCEMTSITIPNSVVSIGEWAFVSSNNLTELKLPNSITNIGNYAFYSMRSLNKINIPTSMASLDGLSLFQFCPKLTSIEIPSNISKIDNGAFLGSHLTNVKIPSSVKYIGDQAFAECDKLVKIDIPSSVTAIGEEAFRSCDNLTSVSIANGLRDIGDRAFTECMSLSDFTIPNTVKSTGFQVFDGCTKLKSVVISNSIDRIEQNFFRNCSSLTSVTISASVTQIMQNAFYGCSSINDIYYSGTKSDWNNVNINETGNQYLDGITVHCADGTISVKGESKGYNVYCNSSFEFFTHSLEEWMAKYPSTTYSPQLAYMMIAMCNSVYNISDMNRTFNAFGFGSSENDRIISESTFLDYAMAKKQTNDGTLVLIVVRGTRNEDNLLEWASNINYFTKNSKGEHSGFADIAKDLNVNLKRLINSGSGTSKNVKYVITGFSRGAAAANILAAHLLDNGVSSKNIYAYTFACPDTIKTSSDVEKRYPCIFNIANVNDFVSWSPTSIPGFSDSWTKYGQSYWYSTNWRDYQNLEMGIDAHNQATYLEFLKNNLPSLNTFKKRGEARSLLDSAVKQRRDQRNQSEVRTRVNIGGRRIKRNIGVHCPVDVEIKSIDGVTVGTVINNVPNEIMPDKVYIDVDGDQKEIFLLDDNQYTIHLIGTGDGIMEYSVQNRNIDTWEVIEEKVFANVTITNGKKMLSYITMDANTELGADIPNIQLIILDSNGKPEKKVSLDGTEVSISNNNEGSSGRPANNGNSSSSSTLTDITTSTNPSNNTDNPVHQSNNTQNAKSPNTGDTMSSIWFYIAGIGILFIRKLRRYRTSVTK